MTAQRKKEVNRRLAEFEYPEPSPLVVKDRLDYTTDLNALARLARKLPQHEMIVSFEATTVGCQIYPGHPPEIAAPDYYEEPTEAEARAEAISQYLESK